MGATKTKFTKKSKGFKLIQKDESATSIFDSVLTEAKLDMGARKHIKKKNFVFPKKAPGHGSFPIHDLAHAKNALSRAAAKGGSTEAAVKAKVYAKYPGLKARHDKREKSTSLFDGIGEQTGLFDSIVEDAKKVEADTEKLARTMALAESLVELRQKIAAK